MDGDGVRARLLAALRSLVAASVAAATAFWRELTLQVSAPATWPAVLAQEFSIAALQLL